MTNKSRSQAEAVVTTFQAFDNDLYQFLMRRLRNRETTEDLAQEVYLRLVRFGGTELPDKPRAYLYRVARNVLYDKLVRCKDERVTFDSSLVERCSGQGTEHPEHGSHTESAHTAIQVSVDDIAEQISNARELEHVLSQLPKTQCAALVLRKGEGLSYAEIAQELRLSIHTVKKYLRLASAQCRSIRLKTSAQAANPVERPCRTRFEVCARASTSTPVARTRSDRGVDHARPGERSRTERAG